MPNLNAALGCAQMERLPEFLEVKAKLAEKWGEFFTDHGVSFPKALNKDTSNAAGLMPLCWIQNQIVINFLNTLMKVM